MRKWMERVRHNRLFFKILLYFLSLLIPIVAIGLYTYFHFTDKLQRDFNEKISLNLQASSRTLDNYMRTVQVISFNFFNDSLVSNLLKPDPLYTTLERSQLEGIIRSITRTRSNINDFVDDIFVYIDDRKIYSSAGMDDFDTFFERVYSFKDYSPDYWKERLQTSPPIDILKVTDVQTMFATKKVIPFVSVKMIRGYSAVIVSTVPIDMILKNVMGNVDAETQIMVVDRNGDMILTSNPGFPNADAVQAINRLDGGKVRKNGEIKLQNESYIASAVTSELYGWTYYAVTPISEFHKQAAGILNMTWVISGVLVVISCVFSFLFAFKVYNPIRRMGEVLQHKDNEVHSIAREYLDNTLLQLAAGHEIVSEQDLQKMLRHHLGFTGDRYLCCAVQLGFTETFYTAIQDVDRFVIQGKFRKLIWGMLQDYVKTYVLERTDNLYICVLDLSGQAALDGLHKGLDSFMRTFRYDSAYINIHIGIGREYAGLSGVTRSYRDAMTALQHRKPDEHFQTIWSQDIEIRHDVQYSFSDEKKLLSLLKLGDMEGIAHMIDEVLRGSGDKLVLSYHDQSALLSAIYNTGLRFCSKESLTGPRFLPRPSTAG
ncbi:hypothetical protein N6H14_20660 [Paenibacillus sp. CC-CFT747]|nr:hypothetical protein N6H14_20660 [Paenibacillus sp. CC-CFT747]